MTPELLQTVALAPALRLLPGKMDTRPARVLLTAIALQESGLRHRRQVPVAFARGWWQFEKGGGVAGVLGHRASSQLALEVCDLLCYPPEPEPVWKALEHNDTLSCAFARLLLWTLPVPLAEDVEAAWEQYIAAWRPGKPHRDRWTRCWQIAQVGVTRG